MKRRITILLIAIITMTTLNIYAKTTASSNNTPDQIKQYYDENSGKISNLSDDILASWYGTLYNNTPSNSFDSWYAKYGKVYNAIANELKSRNIDTSSTMELNAANINTWKPNVGKNSKLTSLGGKILGIIQVMGSIISVISLVVLGIRYMFASVEEKANYKETMIPYVIGAILLFGIVNISSAIYKFASTL